MRVNIVVERGDTEWIGGRMARELAARLPVHGIDAQINMASPYDLTYVHFVYGSPPSRPAIGLFTHGVYRPKTFGPQYDGQVVMNSEMLKYLLEVNCIGARYIPQPVADNFTRDPIVFGVAGRVYGDGRKGEHLVEQMVKAGYHVKAWGQGWPCEILSSDVRFLPSFYRMIDYYVDTSSDEGGCTPALEAMAMGVPVISHSLGVDRPVLSYRTHDWPSLNVVLHQLTHVRRYDDWARDHADYFRAVMSRVRRTAC